MSDKRGRATRKPLLGRNNATTGTEQWPGSPVQGRRLRPTGPADPAAAKGRRGRAYALRGVVGNATLTRDSVTVWFVLRPESVSFRPDRVVETLIACGGAGLAELVGMRLSLRITTRPVPVREIADRTWRDTKASTVDPLPGAVGLTRYTQGQITGADLAEKYAFLGVRIATARRYPADDRREMAGLDGPLARVGEVMARRGLEAVPANAREMDLLLRRSAGLGLPLPAEATHLDGDWDTGDLPALVGDLTITCPPWGKTVSVSGFDDHGDPAHREVAVLTLGRVGDLNIPQDGLGGWMNRADTLGFPVEWMATIDVLSDEKVGGQVRHQIDKIGDQYRHYTVEHGKPAPRALERQNEHALRIEDELSAGLGGLATRTDGWYRLAVWGADADEVRRKVAAVRGEYGRQLEWWWSSGQYELVREFMPGEPLANTAECRRLTTPSVMAGLPAVTAQIGDGYGVLVGQTDGTSHKPVLWNMHADMEQRNRSGLCVLTGSLGSGKTYLGGWLVVQSCLFGVRQTIFDPSGRLGALCELPELKEGRRARHTNLLRGRDGELGPYRVVSDPRREHFNDPKKSELANENDYLEALTWARAQRSSLCLDILSQLLPKMLRDSQHAYSVLSAAVAGVPGDRTSDATQVLHALREIVQGGTHSYDLDWTTDHRIAAGDVLRELELFAATPKGRLVFGTIDPDTDEVDDEDIVLQVYSLHGLRVPSATQLAHGTEASDARHSLVLFNLAAWLTQQRIYLGDPHIRKGLFIDEAHMLSAFEEGANLIEKSSVDSRKHNVRVILCSQNVNHFDIDRITPLTSAVIVGRTTEDNAATDALRLAGLPENPAYIKTLAELTPQAAVRADTTGTEPAAADSGPHEFLFSTKDLGQIERITAYRAAAHIDHALNSTPGTRHDTTTPADTENGTEPPAQQQKEGTDAVGH